MRRPSAAREALRLGPLVQAGWAYPSGVERVPCMTTLAGPLVLFTRSPAAERAPDAPTGWIAALVFLKLAVQNADFVASVTKMNAPHAVDRFTEGCLRVIMSTATHAPKTSSEAKQDPGHQRRTPELSMKK